MKSFFRWTVPLILLACNSVSAAPEGYQVLFKNNMSSKLSEADMRTIFSALGYSITTDGTGLTDDECGQVSFETRLIDLNHDHIPEVVVISGNPCTSGNTGGSINLFIKAPDGKYHGHLGFPANDFVELKTSNKGFPDLLFGGPGLCHGVWHWSGNKYEYKCNWEDTPGACGAKGVKNLCRER